MEPLERVAARPTWLLGRANARAQGLLAAAFAEAGFRGYDYRLLAAMEQFGARSQADLCRLTGIDRKDVATSLDGLAGRGLARRAPDRQDRRRNVVTITGEGRAQLVALDGVLSGVQREVLAPLSESEREILSELLVKLQ